MIANVIDGCVYFLGSMISIFITIWLWFVLSLICTKLCLFAYRVITGIDEEEK